MPDTTLTPPRLLKQVSRQPGARHLSASCRLWLAGAVGTACILASATAPVAAQGAPGGSLFQSSSHLDTKLDDPRPEGGWQGLANVLERIKPSTDTRLDPSPQQITDRIEVLIANNRLDEAYALAQSRRAALEARGPRGGGNDVQLEFQYARLLAKMGRTDEAIDRYTAMTVSYPELPEPWNNLAALHAQRGNLTLANEALTGALQANPTDAAVRANQADVQRRMGQSGGKQTAAPGSTQ